MEAIRQLRVGLIFMITGVGLGLAIGIVGGNLINLVFIGANYTQPGQSDWFVAVTLLMNSLLFIVISGLMIRAGMKHKSPIAFPLGGLAMLGVVMTLSSMATLGNLDCGYSCSASTVPLVAHEKVTQLLNWILPSIYGVAVLVSLGLYLYKPTPIPKTRSASR